MARKKPHLLPAQKYRDDPGCGDHPPGGTNPEPSKLEDFSSFARKVKRIGSRYGRAEDMQDRQRDLLTVAVHFSSHRFRVARAVSLYREGLAHGGWTPLVKVVAAYLMVTDRTLRQWVANYEQVREAPLLVVQTLAEKNIDAVATKNLEVVRGTMQGWLAGLTPEQAVEQAIALAPLHEPPPATHQPVSPMDQWVRDFNEAILKGWAYVPEDQRLEVFCIAAGQMLGRYTKEPVTITPVEPPKRNY